jgi:hypothetical protein
VKNVFASNNYVLELNEAENQKVDKKATDINSEESVFGLNKLDNDTPQKEEIVCLHDMNIWIPEGTNSEASKALKAQWTPQMHKLGLFKTNDAKNVKLNYQKIIFANNFKFTLGKEYEAKCTLMLVEPDCYKLNEKVNEHGESLGVKSQVNYWITVKAIFMKHFPQQITDGDGKMVFDYLLFYR